MKTKILRVLCLLLVISMVAFPVNAEETPEPKFQLQGIEVTLYGKDVEVEIPFITPDSYGIEGQFSMFATDANDAQSEIELTDLKTAFTHKPEEDLVDVSKGIIWVDTDFDAATEAGALVTGIYTIPGDIDAGTYTVSFTLEVFTGEDYEPIEPNETYTATITVKQHKCSDVTTDNDHLCDDVNCPNRENASEHEYAAVVTDPTCTDKGYTTYTCNCGHTYTDNELPAKDHAWGEPAGYTNNGDGTHTAHYVCGNDSQHKKDGEPTEHDFTNGDCVCGAKKPGMKGDVDLDGDVDIDDFAALARHIGEVDEITDATALSNADVESDGVVDINDFAKLAQYIGEIITDLN